MITINEKTAAFLKAVAVAMVFGGLEAVAQNIGASGLVSATMATVIVGVIGLLEQTFSKNGTKALFGSVNVR